MEAGRTITPARARKGFGSSARGFSLGDRFWKHSRKGIDSSERVFLEKCPWVRMTYEYREHSRRVTDVECSESTGYREHGEQEAPRTRGSRKRRERGGAGSAVNAGTPRARAAEGASRRGRGDLRSCRFADVKKRALVIFVQVRREQHRTDRKNDV